MTNLPVPVPAQEAPGNLITGALWNANVYNGLTFLLNPPLFIGIQVTGQSIPNTTFTPVSLDSTVVDSYGGHSNTTNNSRYTAQVAGWYTVCGVGAFVSNTSGFRAIDIHINGATVSGSAMYDGAQVSADHGIALPTRDYYLNAGDYLEMCIWQNTGANLSTQLDADLKSMLWVRWSHA